ncbi:hypothetical protein ACFS5N_16250 [Mucilaginibacter ximonensis]|uniref:Uncharacterized protein n=1 Tax=Mucilaginibacter ximonensis TaxID=538021 RepID=A0ABW5YFI7_9SPHI
MNEDVNSLGPVQIEWIINRQQIAADLEATEQMYDETVGNIEEKAQTAGDAIAKLIAKGGYSDSQKEAAEAVAASVGDISKFADKASFSLDDMKARLVQIQQAHIEFESLDPQIVGLEKYKAGLDAIIKSENELKAAIQQATVAENEQAKARQRESAQIKEQAGLIETLEVELKRLKESRPGIFDEEKLARTNALIQETEAQIARLNNVGKTGFDEFGNALPTEKVSKFTAALNKVSDFSAIGARAVTQLTRQLISLGVGFLSYAVGAKLLEEFGNALEKVFYIMTGGESAMQLNMELAKKAGDIYAEQSVNVRLLVAELQNTNTTQDRQREILSELNQISPTYFGNLKDIHDIVSKLPDAFKKYNEALDLNSRIEAGKALLTDKYKKLLQAENDLLAVQTKKVGDGFLEQFGESLRSMANIIGTIDLAKNVKAHGLSGITDPAAKALVAQIADYQKNIDQLTNGVVSDQLKLQKKGGDIAGNGAKVLAKDAANAIELQKQTVKSDADAQNAIFEDRQKSLKERQAALKQGLNDELNLIGLNEKQQLLNASLSASDRKVVSAKANEERLKAQADYQQKLDNLNKEAADKAAEKRKQQDDQDAESLRNKMALLRELAAANDQFNRRTLSDDQAALTAISDKFDQLRQKIAAFNANPKNKNNQIGQGDINALNPQEFAALGNQADLNETKYIELDLQKKKQLYAEYEAYREKVGKDAANAEYADLLKSGATFEVYIQTLQKSLTDVQNDISPAAFEDRKKLYEKYALEIQKINSSLNLGMLADTLSFQQQLSVIIENGLRKATLLYAAGKKAQGDLILSQAVDEVQLRVDSQQQLISQYKSFYDQISGMTKDEALLQVSFAKDRVKADLDANRISAATYQSLMTYIKQAEDAINSNTILNGLNAIAGALENIARNAEGLDPAFSSTLSTIAQTISQVANMGKQINAFQKGLANFSADKKSAGGGILGTVSAVAGMVPVVGGIISSVVSTVGSVVGAFKAAKESAIAAAKEMKSYQEGLIANEVKYNELLREQASAIKDINALNAQQLEQRKQLLAQQQLEAQSDYNKLLALIQNNGQQVTGEHTEKYGGFLGIARKTKVVQDLAGIGGADYDTLLKLYTEGKLSDETAKWFEQLKNVHDEMGDISDATAAVNDQIDKIFTGTTADSLEQAILTGLKNGKRGFPDFTGDFEQAMQTSLDSIFEDSYLKDKAAAFYKAFAAASESGGGLTPDEISQLKSQYANLVNGASTAYEDLYKITGITPPSGSSSASNSGIVANSIKGISEVQANALEGITRGIQLAVNEIADNQPSNSKAMSDQLDEMRRQTLVQKNIEANTKRTADNTDKMVDSLASIATNTSTTGLTNTLRAAGII